VLRNLLLALPLSACTWITPGEVELKRSQLDDDGDGVPNGEDCAPQVAAEGDATEVPYDALDNDCEGGDLLDVDGDGWPGVDQATWEARRDEAGGRGAWPVALGAQVDCDDTRADVRPDATEVFYDGVRARCDTAHDFDADGDGWLALGWEGTDALAAWDAAWPDAPGEPGDCDDASPQVHPGAPEAPYDGVDADCAFDNDFDADGDGFVAARPVDRWAAFLAYRAQPGYEDVPGEPGDCLDQDAEIDGAVNTALPNLCSLTETMLVGGAVRAAWVFPGACELTLDGIDADCAADDDFDFDLDGWYTEDRQPERDRYAAAWGYVLPGRPGDCNDDNAGIHPEAEEVVNDNVDQDCFNAGDTGTSTAPIRWLEPDYTRPGGPALTATEDGITLALHAEAATQGGWSVRSPSLFAHALEGGPPAPWSTPSLPTSWSTGSSSYGALRALRDGPLVQVFAAGTAGAQHELSLTPLLWDPTLPTSPLEAITDAIARASAGNAAPSDADVWTAPDGRRWWVACRPGELTVVTTPAGLPTATRSTTVTLASAPCASSRCTLGDTCAILPERGQTYVATCAAAGCDLARLSASGALAPTVSFEEPPEWPPLRALRRTGDEADRVVLGINRAGGAIWLQPDDGFDPTDVLEGYAPTQVVGRWHRNVLDLWMVEERAGVDALSLVRIDPDRGYERVWPWHTASPASPHLRVDTIDDGARMILSVLEYGEHGRVGYASVIW
jgi:hypothetical protein